MAETVLRVQISAVFNTQLHILALSVHARKVQRGRLLRVLAKHIHVVLLPQDQHR